MAKKVHTSTGDPEADAAQRAERKRAKALAKLARKEAESQPYQTETPQDSISDQSQADPDIAKKERKAEKKRLKLLRKAAERENASNDAETHITPPSTETSDTALSGEPKTKKRKDKTRREPNTVSNGDSESSKSVPYFQNASLSALPQSDIDSFLSSSKISIEDSNTATPLRPIMKFDHLPQNACASLKASFQFTTPTPIQSASWPFALAGRDIVGIAETGSGKTLAFGLPCLRHIISHLDSHRKGPQAAIVSPTRELAVQIHEQIERLAAPARVKTACVYGGVPKDAQRVALQKASIVIATPGRLNDLVSERATSLSGVTYLVLDEADRMLDKGFEEAIRQIVDATSSNSSSSSRPRQTLMFTATWPPSVRELAASFMVNPVRVMIGDSPSGELRANTRITQSVEVLEPRDKEQRLVQLLRQYQRGIDANARILVFALYKKEAARVEITLRQKGFKVAGIHGDLSQDKRSAALERFKQGQATVLVATDVAARGLDIPDVKVVINVTFPLTAEDYVHRIGRTGRAGATGIAMTLFTEHDKAQAGALINVLKAANQEVPEELLTFGTTVKRKQHDAYGAFYRDTQGAGKAVKIKFDD